MGIVFLIFWVLVPVVIALPVIKKWYLFDRHVKRANRLLEQGAIYEGLCLHYQIDNHQAITAYLVDKLALPTNYPDNFFLKKIVSFLSPDKLRPLIINTYKELAEIKIATSTTNKRIPESLKSDVIQGANFATDALFEICDCLAKVARQNVDLKAIKDELQQEQEKLQQISKIIGETKQELAKLSFSHNRSDVSVDFSNIAVKQAKEYSFTLKTKGLQTFLYSMYLNTAVVISRDLSKLPRFLENKIILLRVSLINR